MNDIDKNADTFASWVMWVLWWWVLWVFKNDLITLLAEQSTLATEVFYKKHPLLDKALEMNSFLFAVWSGFVIFLLSKYWMPWSLNDISHMVSLIEMVIEMVEETEEINFILFSLCMQNTKIFQMPFASIYPCYLTKAEKKGRNKEEVDIIISRLTGYSQAQIQQAHLDSKTTFEQFFAQAQLNPNVDKITRSHLLISYRGHPRSSHASDSLLGQAHRWTCKRQINE